MTEERHIAKAWSTYVERVLPATASNMQHLETRRAFYAGAASLLSSIMASLDPGEEPTDADLARMDAIAAELQAFMDDVDLGHA